MAIFVDCANIVFGTGPARQIINLPEGVLKVRIQQRRDELTRVFLKFADRIERWELELVDGAWRISYRIGRNYINPI